MKKNDPLVSFCKKCKFYQEQEGCSIFQQQELGRVLLDDCPVPIKSKMDKKVSFYAKQYSLDESDCSFLIFESLQAFRNLQASSFPIAEAGARGVLSVVYSLVWRKVATFLRREKGRLSPSMCQWYKGIKGKGSFCVKEEPALSLPTPDKCTSLPCFASFREVGLDAASNKNLAKVEDSTHQLEQTQIKKSLADFLRLSPILYHLFFQYLSLPTEQIGDFKRDFATTHQISIRTVENWHHRSSTLFLSIYTGALHHIEKTAKDLFRVIHMRDFNREYPRPSALMSYGKIGHKVGLSAGKTKELHHEGWRSMKVWMQDMGYPEASSLVLPF